MCYEKRAVSKHIDNLYQYMISNQYTKSTRTDFKSKFNSSEYRKGFSNACMHILYFVVTDRKEGLQGIINAINGEYKGCIKSFLNGNGYMTGEVKKPKGGFALLGWDLLDALQKNDMRFFSYFQDCLLEVKK